MEKAIDYVGYIGHKLSELKTTFNYSKDNRKVVDIKNYKNSPYPYFILNDKDIISVTILSFHEGRMKVMI